MRRQHRRAPFASIMSRQVVVREAAEDLHNLDHGRCLPSQAGHQLVENVLERGPGRLGPVAVYGGCREFDCADQSLVIIRIPYLTETQRSAAWDLMLPELLIASGHRMRP